MSRGVDSFMNCRHKQVDTTETNWIAEIGEFPPSSTDHSPTPKAERGRHLKEPYNLGTSPKSLIEEHNRHHRIRRTTTDVGIEWVTSLPS